MLRREEQLDIIFCEPIWIIFNSNWEIVRGARADQLDDVCSRGSFDENLLKTVASLRPHEEEVVAIVAHISDTEDGAVAVGGGKGERGDTSTELG